MRRGAVVVAAVLASRASQGAELRSSLTGSAQYSTNAAGTGESSDQGGNADVRLDGQVRLDLTSDPGQRFTWRFGYAPAYERFLDLQDLDNWRHQASAGFTYALSSGTTLAGNASFMRSIRTRQEDVAGVPEPEPILEELEERIDRGSAGLSLSHYFAPRWSGSTSVGYSFTDYERADRSDFEAATASTSLSYTMTARQSLGGGLSLSRQIVKEADIQTASGDASTRSEQETRFASLFGSWGYQLSPLWKLDLRAGPTLIDSDVSGGTDVELPPVTRVPSVGGFPLDANLCTFVQPVGNGLAVNQECFLLPTPLPPDFVSPEAPLRAEDLIDPAGAATTLFANFGIVRNGERSQFSLAYSRSAGDNLGGRTSTVADVLSSAFSWQPDADWRLEVRAAYSKRQQATSASVLSGFPLVANAGSVSGIPDDVAIVAVGPDGSARVLTEEVDDAFDVDSWSLFARATRRLTRRLSAFVSLRYADQRNNGLEGGVVQDLDNFEIGLGVSYSFDRIRF
jgi:hypothetical protein